MPETPPVIIFNPTARGDKAIAFRRFLETLSGQAVLRPTRQAGDATELAAAAVAEGFTTLVAAGGDGTVNEVLNGLARETSALERVRLGVLPLGTVNVFAKELELPAEAPSAWEVVRAGRERRIDLPEAEYRGVNGSRVRRCFAQLGGAGLDSRAIAAVRWEEKKRWGRVAYVLAGLRALRQAAPSLEVALEDGTRAVGELVLLGNGRLYGGWWPVFPSADLSDGRIDVLLVPKVNLRTLLGMIWALQRRRFASYPAVRHFQSTRVELRTSAACELELEGDNVGFLPAICTVRRQALRVVVP